VVRQLTTVVTAFLLLLSFAVSAKGAAPQEYADWLVRASEADFVFLKGAHQNGYFVAVFAVGEDKMAVCYRDLNLQLNRVEVQLSILDKHGEELIVFGGNHLFCGGRSARPMRRSESNGTRFTERCMSWSRKVHELFELFLKPKHLKPKTSQPCLMTW
jgi:hypothetical protein